MIKQLLVVGALALAFPAQAAVTITGATTVNTILDQSPDGSFQIGFSDANLTNPFDEILEFNTTVSGLLSITATTTANFVGGPNDTDFSSLIFRGPLPFGPGSSSVPIPATPFSTDLNEFYQLSNIMIDAGRYRLRLQGTPGTQNSGFGGDVAFTAGAIPEPATWLMMILGFAGIGFSMRRKSTAHRVQFA